MQTHILEYGIKLLKIKDNLIKPSVILIYGNNYHNIVNKILINSNNTKVLLLMEDNISKDNSLVNFIPKNNVSSSSILSIKYNNKLLDNIMSNKTFNYINNKEEDKLKLLILNNILNNNNILSDNKIDNIFFMSRLMNLSSILILNGHIQIPPNKRENIDYLILCTDLSVSDLDYLYKTYNNKMRLIFKSYMNFIKIYNTLKKNNNSLIINLHININIGDIDNVNCEDNNNSLYLNKYVYNYNFHI